MELNHLATFRTVATLGSFSQAAGVLGYAQSTVSEHIRSLEADLDARLFRRSGSKRITLTASGEVLLQYAQKMSNLEQEIQAEVKEQPKTHGTLSVRVPETVSIHYLPRILKRYRARYPEVNLGFMNCVYFDLPEELKAGIVDLGFLITDEFRMPDLESEVLRPIPLVMVTYPGHALASSRRFDVAQLKGEPLIVPANDCSYTRMLDRILTERKVQLPLIWRFNSLAAIKQVVKSGMGVAVLPKVSVQSELADGSLAVLPWREKGIDSKLLMIWQKNKWLPPILAAFMGMIRDELAVSSTPKSTRG